MRYEVVCHCCTLPIPVTAKDIGKAVICPVTRELVPVTTDSMRGLPESSGRGRRLITAAILLIAAGLTALILWPTREPARSDGHTAKELAQGSAGASSDPAAGAPPAATSSVPPAEEPSASSATGARAPGAPAPDAVASPPKPDGVRVSESASVASHPVSGKDRAGTEKPVSRADKPSAETAVGRRFARYQLEKRIDLRSEDELRKELLGVREVSLDTAAAPDTSAKLIAYAQAQAAAGSPYPGPLAAAVRRPDLAGLPYLSGPDAVLSRDRARNLAALSVQLRQAIQLCIPAGQTDPRPNPDKLYAALMAEGSDFRSARWATAEAVPCVRQMLQPEETEIRRMSIELLRPIDSAAATEALTSWAVFDLDAGCRAAAVDALRSRDKKAVTDQLLALTRYPWPRAAEHAAEALVALRCEPAVPVLAALLALPAPDAPIAFPADRSRPVKYRREMVRTNHARNCVLCHAPSASESDLVRSAVPDPKLPLASPLTPDYYRDGRAFVAADRTYLRQDFSTFQPVANPGPWPVHQRYDFLVSFQDAKGDADREPDPAYREALLFALRELSGRDQGADASAWTSLRGDRTMSDSARSEIALALLSQTDSSPYLMLKLAEFGSPFLRMTESERSVVTVRLRKLFGWASFRLAMIAYLEPLTRTGDQAERELAARLLDGFVSETNRPGELTSQELADSLAALGHKNARLRRAAVGNLGGAGAEKVWERLMRILESDPDPGARREAALALATVKNLPYRGGLALAECCAAEEDASIRLAIAGALRQQDELDGALGSRIADLMVAGRKWDTPEQSRAFVDALADALVRLGRRAEGATGPLARAAGQPGGVPPAALARALRAVGPPADEDLPHLVAALANKDLRPAAEAVLLSVRDRAVGALIGGLKSPDAGLRTACAEVLGPAAALDADGQNRALWRKAIDALAAAKVDSSADVRASARASLDKLTPSR